MTLSSERAINSAARKKAPKSGQADDILSNSTGQLSPLPPVQFSDSQRIAAKLVLALEKTAGTGFTLQICGEYIEKLPSRIGYSTALDTSILYLLSVHSQLQDMRASFHQSSICKNYASALKHLKREVEDPTGHDPEALVAATIVLGDAEVCYSPTLK